MFGSWYGSWGKPMRWPSRVNLPIQIKNPLGDADKDGVRNIFDCRPYNPKKHYVPVSFARLFYKEGNRKEEARIHPTRKIERRYWEKAKKKRWREYYGLHETSLPSGKKRVYLNPSLEWETAKKIKANEERYPRAKNLSKERVFTLLFTSTAAHEALHHGISKTKEHKKGIKNEAEEKVVEEIETVGSREPKGDGD